MEQPDSIPVIAKDGARGVIVSAPPAETGPAQVLVRFETGAQVLVPAESLTLQADGRYYYLPFKLADLTTLHTESDTRGSERIVLPVIAEELDVQRRVVEIGRVRVSKLVNEREEIVDEPLLREEIDVEHVAINRVIDRPIPVRNEGDTIVVPVLEEVLVVEKRLMLKEELRITRRQTTTSQPQRVVLRSEEVRVDRVDPGADIDGGKERAVGSAPNPEGPA